MIQLGGDRDFPEEPLRPDRRGQLRTKNLDRDLSVVLPVVSQVDGGHPTPAKLTLDLVAITQGDG
jgi:hypothetical protein